MMTDMGLLILRVGVGLMMALGHGWSKLDRFSQMVNTFPNPIGLGSTLSLIFVIGAEFFCAVAVVLGIGTRIAASGLVFTMLVAGVLHHSADPWSVKELAFVYVVPFLALVFTGGGKYALDVRIKMGKRS